MITQVLSKLKNCTFALVFAIGIALLPSCEKDSFNRYGFDSAFDRNSSGLTVMSISNNVSSIVLRGDVLMDSGELTIELTNPEGLILYRQHYFAPHNYNISETFKASPGMWKLSYTSLEGTGSIDLHANYK